MIEYIRPSKFAVLLYVRLYGYVFDSVYKHRLCSGKSQVRKSLIIQQTIIKLFQEISSVKSNIATDGLIGTYWIRLVFNKSLQ